MKKMGRSRLKERLVSRISVSVMAAAMVLISNELVCVLFPPDSFSTSKNVDSRYMPASSTALRWARWRTFSSAPAKVSPSAITYSASATTVFVEALYAGVPMRRNRKRERGINIRESFIQITIPLTGWRGNVTKTRRKEERLREVGRRLSFFREDLSKWMDFDPFKYTIDCIGVFASKPLCIFQRVCFDNDETSCLIREWTG